MWPCRRVHPASYFWIQGVISPSVKRPEREADHSPSSNYKVKNQWTFISASPCTLKARIGTSLPLPCQNPDMQWIPVVRKCHRMSQNFLSSTSLAQPIKRTFYPLTCHSHGNRPHTLDDRRGASVDVSHWVIDVDSWQWSILGDCLLVIYVIRCQ